MSHGPWCFNSNGIPLPWALVIWYQWCLPLIGPECVPPDQPWSGNLGDYLYSAGMGRTGTLLLVLTLLDQLQESGQMDPPAALVALRQGRPNLVENQVRTPR